MKRFLWIPLVAILLIATLNIYNNFRIKYLWKGVAINDVYCLKESDQVIKLEKSGKNDLKIGYQLNGKIRDTVVTIAKKTKRKPIYLAGGKFIEFERQQASTYHILNSNIATPKAVSYSFSDFTSIDHIDYLQRKRILKYLADWKIDSLHGSVNKLQQISLEIRKILRNGGDELTMDISRFCAVDLFEAASQNKTKVTCGEYSEIMFDFLNVAGIPTRRVALTGEFPSDLYIKQTGHHFNEVYIKEIKKWAHYDLSSDKIFICNSDKVPLNTYELWIAEQSKNIKDLQICTTLGDSAHYLSYLNNSEIEKRYFGKSDVIHFKFGGDRFSMKNKLNRLLLTSEPALNTVDQIYFKQIVLFGWIVFAGIFIYNMFSHKKTSN